MTVTIYHNPACGTSRTVLGLLRARGEQPVVVEYLKTPPSREKLQDLVARMGVPLRDVLRVKATPYTELGLADPGLTDDQLLDAMMAHPILINRPIVVTPLGVKLCRPAETVLDLLPPDQHGLLPPNQQGRVPPDQRGAAANRDGQPAADPAAPASPAGPAK